MGVRGTEGLGGHRGARGAKWVLWGMQLLWGVECGVSRQGWARLWGVGYGDGGLWVGIMA